MEEEEGWSTAGKGWSKEGKKEYEARGEVRKKIHELKRELDGVGRARVRVK